MLPIHIFNLDDIPWASIPRPSACPTSVGSTAAAHPSRLDRALSSAHGIVVTRGRDTEAARQIERLGLRRGSFNHFLCETDLASCNVSDLLRDVGGGLSQNVPVFVHSQRLDDLRWAASQQDGVTVVPVGLVSGRPEQVAASERAGAWFVARSLDEVAGFVAARPANKSISVVLMAYNEAATIAQAILEARRFCRLYFESYEIIVVDDGSSDATATLAKSCDDDDVQLIQHPTNLGMGATMRDGYAAATKTYITSLPADRQVRAQSLLGFLPHLDPARCVYSLYDVPHSGPHRHLMSAAFRLVLRHVGQLTVDFAGAYIFHTSWWERVDRRPLRSDSFVFSYELLQAFDEAGCEFMAVPITPFLRTAGSSRVARPGRIVRVFGEVLSSRLARIKYGSGAHL